MKAILVHVPDKSLLKPLYHEHLCQRLGLRAGILQPHRGPRFSSPHPYAPSNSQQAILPSRRGGKGLKPSVGERSERLVAAICLKYPDYFSQIEAFFAFCTV